MIVNQHGYSEHLQQRIASALNLVPSGQTEAMPLVRGYDGIAFSGPQPFSERYRLQLKPSEMYTSIWARPDKPTVPRLIFYEMLWAPLRDEVKNYFLACFESRSVNPNVDCSPLSVAKPNTDPRALVNGAIKDRILVNGVADAMIVSGPIGDMLRDDVSLAMCTIATEELASQGFALPRLANQRCDLAAIGNDQSRQSEAAIALTRAPFHVITHSLGSFLVIDALTHAAQLRAKLKADTTRETLAFHLLDHATVYMMANQISLLNLGRLKAKCITINDGEECPNRLLDPLNQSIKDDEPLNLKTTYVAFNDANDILDFELQPYYAKTGLVGPLVNISVRNPVLAIPFLFKNPIAVHNGYDDNSAVIEAIVMGFDLPMKDVKK